MEKGNTLITRGGKRKENLIRCFKTGLGGLCQMHLSGLEAIGAKISQWAAVNRPWHGVEVADLKLRRYKREEQATKSERLYHHCEACGHGTSLYWEVVLTADHLRGKK